MSTLVKLGRYYNLAPPKKMTYAIRLTIFECETFPPRTVLRVPAPTHIPTLTYMELISFPVANHLAPLPQKYPHS